MDEVTTPGVHEIDGWVFDFSQWTLGDLEDYNKGVSNPRMFDTEKLRQVAANTIVKWPYEKLNCRKPESYRKLLLSQWRDEVQPRLIKAVAQEFSK